MKKPTALEERVIALAREHGVLAETCRYVDYDPDIGRVPEHWRARYEVMLIAEGLREGSNPKGECPPAPSSGDSADDPGGSAPQAVDLDAAKRLRRVCNALGLADAVPDDDARLWGVAFSVLGMVARKVEASAPSVQVVEPTPCGGLDYCSPLVWIEAEPAAKGVDLRTVAKGLLLSTCWHWQAERPTPKQPDNVLFPLYAQQPAREWHSEGVPPAGSTCLVWVKPSYAKEPYYMVDNYGEQHEAPVSWSSATIPVGEGWDSFDHEDVLAWSLLDEAGPLASPTAQPATPQPAPWPKALDKVQVYLPGSKTQAMCQPVFPYFDAMAMQEMEDRLLAQPATSQQTGEKP